MPRCQSRPPPPSVPLDPCLGVCRGSIRFAGSDTVVVHIHNHRPSRRTRQRWDIRELPYAKLIAVALAVAVAAGMAVALAVVAEFLLALAPVQLVGFPMVEH